MGRVEIDAEMGTEREKAFKESARSAIGELAAARGLLVPSCARVGARVRTAEELASLAAPKAEPAPRKRREKRKGAQVEEKIQSLVDSAHAAEQKAKPRPAPRSKRIRPGKSRRAKSKAK